MRQIRTTITPHKALDARGASLAAAAPTVGVDNLSSVRVSDLYFVRGELSDADIQRLCDDMLIDPAALDRLRKSGQIALTYRDGTNPNGSLADIAGICNPAGNVLGLMPHPEDHIYSWQHPQHTRGAVGGAGLALFCAGVDAAR